MRKTHDIAMYFELLKETFNYIISLASSTRAQ